jgi:hypothetical protein
MFEIALEILYLQDKGIFIVFVIQSVPYVMIQKAIQFHVSTFKCKFEFLV